jgi:hypothetical protein
MSRFSLEGTGCGVEVVYKIKSAGMVNVEELIYGSAVIEEDL